MVDTTAKIMLHGRMLGAVAWVSDKGHAVFEYDPAFVKNDICPSPLHMPLANNRSYMFPELNPKTFQGLPGLLADALPDKFGNDLINIWLAQKGKSVSDYNPVSRLCYKSTRGMGALEFFPQEGENLDKQFAIEIEHLVKIEQKIMEHKNSLDVYFGGSEAEKEKAMAQILSVSTSAGGARPKAVLAINQENHVLSGQTAAPEGYVHWLMKLDGVTDSQLGKPKEYGKIEYAYFLMAKDAHIEMAESKLMVENGRHHFLTKRFDRIGNEKIHMQTLCGLCHYDFNSPGSYGYEQVFAAMRSLGLPRDQAEQQYRRMIFNVVARNQDDHTKNIAFLMSKSGQWRLSPAYDVNYSHNPAGSWTSQHQMSVNGKKDGFTRDDFKVVGQSIGLSQQKINEIVDQTLEVVSRWPGYAQKADLSKDRMEKVEAGHRVKSIEKQSLSRVGVFA